MSDDRKFYLVTYCADDEQADTMARFLDVMSEGLLQQALSMPVEIDAANQEIIWAMLDVAGHADEPENEPHRAAALAAARKVLAGELEAAWPSFVADTERLRREGVAPMVNTELRLTGDSWLLRKLAELASASGVDAREDVT